MMTVPWMMKKMFFVISPNTVQDLSFTHEVQRQISEHLKSINCQIDTIHEFTDSNCVTQYKSRHCFADVTYAEQYFQIIKNFFETSHAKGAQDAAGDLVPKPIWRWVIHNAENVYDF